MILFSLVAIGQATLMYFDLCLQFFVRRI